MISSPWTRSLPFCVPAACIPNSGIYGTNRSDHHPSDRNPKGFDKNGPTMVPLPRHRVYVLLQMCSLPASGRCRTDVIAIHLDRSPLYTRRYTKLRPVRMMLILTATSLSARKWIDELHRVGGNSGPSSKRNRSK